MGKCNFNSRWLSDKDSSGRIISTWATKLDKHSVLCKACDKKITLQRGFQSLLQHARGDKHLQQVRTKFEHNQLHLEVRQNVNNNINVPENTVLGQIPGSIQLYSVRESAIRAELIWTMRSVIHNYSFLSCEGIAETFSAMFPGASNLTNEFTMSPTKMRYLVTEALGPFFKEKLLDDIQGAYYSLCYDETTNKAGEKEFQVQVRFWSKRENCIVSKHLNTSYMRHATGEDLFREINVAITSSNLSKQKLLMLGSDGPNVNKKVARLVNEDILLYRSIGLVDVGVCNIHVIHNAFLKGLDPLGSNTADLLVALKYFFKDKPARWDDYQKIQIELGLPNHRFIKHINTRWLTLADAAARLLEQWPAVNEWKLLSVDVEVQKIDVNVRVDQFWQKIFEIKRDNEELKYPNLTILIKAVLCLSHGNADVERGFSSSGRVLTKERASMSEKMLNSLIFITDGLKFYNNKAESVPINKNLVTLAQSAHQKYKADLEQKRNENEKRRLQQIEEEQELKKKQESVDKLNKEKNEIAKIELQIAKNQEDRDVQSNTYNEMLNEANKKLKWAISKKDFVQINIAQTMIESANKLREEENKKNELLDKTKRKVEKRKATLLDNFVAKVAKK